MSKTIEIHDAANIFPLAEGELESLAKDIAENGLHVPIETLDGKLIDGRRRARACEIAKVEPKYREIKTDDPIAYVLSINLHRRHLSPTQLAMVGARARRMYDDAAKERQHEGQERGRSVQKGLVENLPPTEKEKARDAVGKAVGVSGKSIDSATRVLRNGTEELIKAVESDEVAVSTAEKESTKTPREQAEFLKRVRENGSKKRPRPATEAKPEEPEKHDGKSLLGVGVIRANEAINCLIRIPKNDALRKRGFQLVTDWIKANNKGL